ncbi:SNF1-interacting protein, partial [Quaeritorhiza haematococci]
MSDKPTIVLSGEGTVSSDPSVEVTLEMAVRDSPYFRANINHFEDELEDLAKWLDGLCKALRGYADELQKTNEATTVLVTKLVPQGGNSLIDMSCVRTLSDALQTVYSLKAKLVDDLVEHLTAPLHAYLREDIRDMRETRRNFDKVMEKYDQAVAKYASLSKTKEASALREDAFQLYEIRKAYIRSALDYGHKVTVFKTNLEHFILDQLLCALYAHTDFYETSYEVFHGLKPSMDALKMRLDQGRATMNANIGKIEATKRSLEEDAVTRCNPSTAAITDISSNALSQNGVPSSSTSSASSLPSSNPSTTVANQAPGFAMMVPSPSSSNLMALSGSPQNPSTGSSQQQTLIASTATGAGSSSGPSAGMRFVPYEKEGYLYKRSQPKGLIVPVWSRRYFIIKSGGFSYCVTSNSGKHRGMVMSTTPLNILLCNVKVDKAEKERRFTFEVYTSRKTFMLQAETEEDMNDWIATIQAAKYHAATSDKVSSSLNLPPLRDPLHPVPSTSTTTPNTSLSASPSVNSPGSTNTATPQTPQPVLGRSSTTSTITTTTTTTTVVPSSSSASTYSGGGATIVTTAGAITDNDDEEDEEDEDGERLHKTSMLNLAAGAADDDGNESERMG